MQPIPMAGDLNDYLASSGIIDFNDETVSAAARGLSANTENEIVIARAIFEFVRDKIPHTFDIGADEVPCRASDVLRHGHGLCYAKSHLLAALMRYSGVPAGFCYQRLTDEDQPSGYVLHGFNAIYLKSPGRWVKLDARGNKPGINVRFNVDSDMHAYKVDERLGESEDPRIFAVPADCVIKALAANTSARTLPGRLPDSL